MDTINIRHLKKYFGPAGRAVKAVDDISFAVEQGEVFGYLGPNGAGKSTTIACMMGFLYPTEGEISLFEQSLANSANQVALKRRIGYLSSDVHLYKGLSGAEHIRLVSKVRGRAALADRLIKDLDFNPHIKVKYLSTGNRQKLGIILCFMSEPELLLLDEPTRGLDPLLQQTLYSYVDEFKKKGATAFISSHNLTEVEKLCDRVGIIKNGKLQAIEHISALFKKKLHVVRVYSADFAKMEATAGQSSLPIGQTDYPLTRIRGGVEFRYQGNIDALIRELGRHKLDDVEITRASLEEIFLEFYK